MDDHSLALINTFQEISGIEDLDRAKDLLESCNWNIEMAVNTHFAMMDGSQAPQTQDLPSYEDAVNEPAQPSQQFFQQNNPFNTRSEEQNQPEEEAVEVEGPSFWTYIWSFFTSFFSIFFESLSTPSQSPAEFIDKFKGEFGDLNFPAFSTRQFHEAVMSCKEEGKLMLVYLHKANDPLCSAFVRNVLANPEVSALVSETIVWGGDASFEPAASVASSFRVSAPFLGVMAPRGQHNQVVLAGRMTGSAGPQAALRLIKPFVEMMKRQGEEERNRQAALEIEKNLMEQQRREFEESLAADKAAKDEKEKIEEEQQSQERKHQSLLQQRREETASIKPEYTGENAAKIAVVLPNGQRVQRAFEVDDTLSSLFIWVQSHDPGLSWDFSVSLVQNYPNKVFLPSDQTLSEAGLAPKSLLRVMDANLSNDS